MSQIDYTTTALISSIKRKGSIPTVQDLFSNTDFVEIINSELQTYIVPFLLRVREEYLVTSVDHTIVSGTKEYEIPSQAIGKKLRAVYEVDTAGNYIELPRINFEDISMDCSVKGYYVLGDNIVLTPSPTQSGTLRMFYYRRPNKLVTTDLTAKISLINTGTNEVTCADVPSSWTTLTQLDVIDKDPSFLVKVEATQASLIAGFVLTLPAAVVALLSVGDYIAEVGESPIPQIPVECFPLIEQASVVKCCEAMGDQTGGFQASMAKLKEMEGDVINLISPRVDGNAKKISTARGIWSY